MGKNQQQYLGDLKKRQSLNFQKKKKKILPLSIFKMQATNEKPEKKNYEKRLENQINSFLACVSIRQEKNLQKIKKCTKKSQNISLKKKKKKKKKKKNFKKKKKKKKKKKS